MFVAAIISISGILLYVLLKPPVHAHSEQMSDNTQVDLDRNATRTTAETRIRTS
ncbi:hypothetical protein DESME_05125 [Desulfitobacterium metallireducens DSM 15288]|uniref:Uncharacterized protein n=1 Tax=Desulfitobacterium metallireducens DSM 15288 TaxID=871968 RepID=W0ECK0_9FIRM|nr:hypothetical protein DESME_05125 [Desulfitobacterium metallireducens DSM 15288]